MNAIRLLSKWKTRINETTLWAVLLLFLFGTTSCSSDATSLSGQEADIMPTPVSSISSATPTSTPVPSVSTESVTAIPASPTPTVTPLLPTLTATPLPPTATATPGRPTATHLPPTATATPLPPTAPPLPTNTPAATASPVLPPVTPTSASQIMLVEPLAEAGCFGDYEIHFEWQWDGPFDPVHQGFELRIWRVDEPQVGAHDAVLDNKSGLVKALEGNRYSLDMKIGGAAGVEGRTGEYLWTVLLVQIEPTYQELGLQAGPERLCYAAPGSGGGSDDSDSGSNGGGNNINP